MGNQANGALFTGCGFYLNPAYSIVLGYAAQLKNLKILRSGLLSNPTGAQTSSAVAVWAAEALNLVPVCTAVGANILTLPTTSGLSVGMAVYGKGILPGTTIQSLSPTSVTLSRSVAGTSVGGGQGVRFGASMGCLLARTSVITSLRISR